MKTKRSGQRVPTRFGRPTRFELSPKVVSLSDQEAQQAFHQLQARLVQPVLTEADDPTTQRQLRLAANEAAAVAWTTPYPLLLLPVLLEEKTEEARRYLQRQEEVHDSNSVLAPTGC